MITYVQGDLLTAPSKVLVNTVNTVGVMGKGIAKTFKEVYPEMFREYQRLCESKQLAIGTLWLFKTKHKWVLNFPTKQNWRQPSKPEYIEAGLQKFAATYGQHGITSIAFPRLGCGNGELSWEAVVQPLMAKYLDRLPIDIFVYSLGANTGQAEHRDPDRMKEWLRSEPNALAFAEVWEDLAVALGGRRDFIAWDDHATPFWARIAHAPNGEAGIEIVLSSQLSGFGRLLERVTRSAPQSIRIQILGPNHVLIPHEGWLDLWQVIRTYGFCLPRNMPGGLDLAAQYVLPILSCLPYLSRVSVTTPGARAGPKEQEGLQLLGVGATPSKPLPQLAIEQASRSL